MNEYFKIYYLEGALGNKSRSRGKGGNYQHRQVVEHFYIVEHVLGFEKNLL